MITKQLYVLLDSDGDVKETFPENSNIDYMFELKQATCPNGTLHKATLVIGPEEHERIHSDIDKFRYQKFLSEADDQVYREEY